VAAVIERRSPTARFITRLWPFDLDDICPEVTEQHRAQRTGEHASQIEYFEAFEHEMALLCRSTMRLLVKLRRRIAGCALAQQHLESALRS
jgi:hypothetical protein